jgi:nicotinamide-nucleotide amidase
MNLDVISQQLFEQLRKKNLTISTAESCTGGMIVSQLVGISGISKFLIEGIVTYSNNSKILRLGVNPKTIQKFGAVSEETVVEMLNGLKTDCRIAVSGIAGPNGGTLEKPVGTVFIGVQFLNKIIIKRYLFSGSRNDVREKSTKTALKNILNLIS